MEKWVEGKLNEAFLDFLAYLMIFQSGTSSNMAKNWQKMTRDLVQIAMHSTHFSARFRVLVPPLPGTSGKIPGAHHEIFLSVERNFSYKRYGSSISATSFRKKLNNYSDIMDHYS